ncbi:MAG: CPXCG motif-containing cysteine-rich protein [Chthoniobacteraceae bacterium]
MNQLEDAEVLCPYCGSAFSISVDTMQGTHSTTEDCAICCRPIALRIECAPGEVLGVTASVG